MGNVRFPISSVRLGLGNVRFLISNVRFGLGNVRFQISHVRFGLGNVSQAISHVIGALGNDGTGCGNVSDTRFRPGEQLVQPSQFHWNCRDRSSVFNWIVLSSISIVCGNSRLLRHAGFCLPLTVGGSTTVFFG